MEFFNFKIHKLRITPYHSKQNHVKAIPQTRPTERLVEVETRLG